MRFVADLAQVRHARTWAVSEATHAGASEDVQRVVGLLTSEVVTNAVRHGPIGGMVDVRVSATGDRLRVSVRDESPQRPIRLEPDPTALAGRGVLLVDRLASDWGVEPESGAKTVWFEVSLRPRRTPARGRERT